MFVLLAAIAFAPDAFGSLNHAQNNASSISHRVNRKDPAFRAGYDDGYRQGASDSAALSNRYSDESGPLYEQAIDGYTPQYGDRQAYQRLFRQGYVAGYKAGWDFNSGQYNPLGAGSW